MIKISKPQRPITWIVVMPFAVVSLAVVFVWAVMLTLLLPSKRRNLCACTACANCGGYYGQHPEIAQKRSCRGGTTEWEESDETVTHKLTDHYTSWGF